MAYYQINKSLTRICFLLITLSMVELIQCRQLINKQFCMDRTGLGLNDVESFNFRNEK